jgi:hypothetical protein
LPREPSRITSFGGLVIGVVTNRCAYVPDFSDQRGTVIAALDPMLGGHGSREFEVSFGYEPLDTSVALNAVVSPALCAELDQRGAMRSRVDAGTFPLPCDAGAVEQGGIGKRRTVMMIVGNRSFTPTDLVLSIKLREYGFEVFDESPTDSSAEVEQRQLALISETVNSSELPSWLFSISRPILSLEPGALDELGMTRESWDQTQGVALGASKLNILSSSPIDIGLTGEVDVTNCCGKFGWGVPATHEAFKVAELASAPDHWAIFGYEKGAGLANGARARAARVAFFAATDTPQRMNDAG